MMSSGVEPSELGNLEPNTEICVIASTFVHSRIFKDLTAFRGLLADDVTMRYEGEHGPYGVKGKDKVIDLCRKKLYLGEDISLDYLKVQSNGCLKLKYISVAKCYDGKAHPIEVVEDTWLSIVGGKIRRIETDKSKDVIWNRDTIGT